MDPAVLTDEERALPRDEVGWFSKYGVTFKDVGPTDLELLRTWRNHPEIRRFMVFRDEITPEMQQRWYASIDPERESYSILFVAGEAIGLTQLRHIDARSRSAEGGIIMFRAEHQNGVLPYRAAIAGMDWNFLQRKLERLDVTVLKSNQRARRFVRSLGYVLEDPDPAGDVLKGSVTSERFFRAAAQWRPIIRTS
jgi:RimJ/RimL family protein N-acetyltransferase